LFREHYDLHGWISQNLRFHNELTSSSNINSAVT